MGEPAPPGWFSDPDNPAFYRYWDGTTWTEHRSPRTAPHAGPRPAGELIGDSFSVMSRRWRPLTRLGLIAIAANAVAFGLLLIGLDGVLDGKLSEMIELVGEPGFDPRSSDTEAFFDSIDVAARAGPTALLVAGAVVSILAALAHQAAVSRLTLTDLDGRRMRAGQALGGALRRTPRLVGVVLQLVVIGVAFTAISLMFALLLPILLLVLVPAAIAALVIGYPVIVLALTTAAAGPPTPSIPYAWHLTRGRLGAVVGRTLLALVVALAVGFGVNILTSPASAVIWWAGIVAGVVVQPLQVTYQAAAVAIVYHDLDGEMPDGASLADRSRPR